MNEFCHIQGKLIALKPSLQFTEMTIKQYDKIARGIALCPGDCVLIRSLEKGGPGKIRSYWEDKVYKVLSRLNKTSLVHTLEQEKGEGRKLTFYMRLLLMIQHHREISQPTNVKNR